MKTERWRVEKESCREHVVTDGVSEFRCGQEESNWLCEVLNEREPKQPVEPTPFPPHEIITWDWKERCPTQSVIEACKQFAGPVSFDVETNCDEYAIVIGGSGMTQKIADAIYHAER